MVRFKPTYAHCNYVFVGRTTLTSSGAEPVAARGYAKLMQKNHSLYQVLCVGPEYLNILLGGV